MSLNQITARRTSALLASLLAGASFLGAADDAVVGGGAVEGLFGVRVGIHARVPAEGLGIGEPLGRG